MKETLRRIKREEARNAAIAEMLAHYEEEKKNKTEVVDYFNENEPESDYFGGN